MAQGHVTGIFEWMKWGASYPADQGFGVVTGDFIRDPQPRQRAGAGGTEIRRGGLIKSHGSANYYVTASNQALISYGLRASYPRGVLSGLWLAGGADEWGVDLGLAYFLETTLEYAHGEGLKCAQRFEAFGATGNAGGEAVMEDNLDFEDYEAVIAVLGDYYGVIAATVKVSNAVTFKTNGDPKESGAERVPVYATLGKETSAVDVTCGIPIPEASLGIWARLLPNDGTAAMAFNNTVNTGLVTLQNLQTGSETLGIVGPDTEAEWKYQFHGSSANGSVGWSWE